MERFKIEFKWASIFTAINLAWVYLEKYLGLHSDYIEYHSIVGLIILLPFIFCIYWCIKQKKQVYYKGTITWQKAFLSGTFLSLLIAGLSIGTTYVMAQYISPDIFKNAITKSMEMGANENFVKQFFNLDTYIKNNILFYMAFGIMTSAIFGLITKRKT